MMIHRADRPRRHGRTLAALLLSAAAAGPAHAVPYDFSTFSDRHTYTLSPSGVDITATAASGSAGVVTVSAGNGLGVFGGDSDDFLDSTEAMQFDFTAPPTGNATDRPKVISNVDGDARLGEARVEAFEDYGNSLGTYDAYGFDRGDVSSRFGGTPDTDALRR